MIESARAKILVVCYNSDIRSSLTLNTLIGVEGKACADIVIRDNSPTQRVFQKDAESLLSGFNSVRVDWDGENKHLARLYNDVGGDLEHCDWLVLLDDDTTLASGYLLEVFKVDRVAPHINLVLPVVVCGDRIVSPGDYRFVKGRHWNTAKRGTIKSGSVTAITSGMAIRARYFQRHPRPFDETLSFYGIDTRFCLDFRAREPAVFVTDATLQHDSALWKSKNSSEKRRRFKMLKLATYEIHKGQPLAVITLIFFNAFSSLRRAIFFRDIRYIL